MKSCKVKTSVRNRGCASADTWSVRVDSALANGYWAERIRGEPRTTFEVELL